jgi:hypothetical protein
MKQIIILFISILLLSSCSRKPAEGDIIYHVIRHEQKNSVENTASIPPPPVLEKPFYGHYNFILLDTSTIFLHERNKHYTCGYGLDDTKPFFLDLTPEDLTEIGISKLETFLQSIPDSIISYGFFYASASSPQDTIRNRGYKIISDFFKSKNIRFNTRNITEEEQYVLAAKLENKKYDPSALEWKVGFGDTDTLEIESDTVRGDVQ